MFVWILTSSINLLGQAVSYLTLEWFRKFCPKTVCLNFQAQLTCLVYDIINITEMYK